MILLRPAGDMLAFGFRAVGAPVLGMLFVFALATQPARASDLVKLEDEFEKAIKEVTPATVVCMPMDAPKGAHAPASSGVMVYRKGLVLSDGDAGMYVVVHKDKKKKNERKWAAQVEIRIPNLKGKGFRSYPATVLHRDREIDTSLLQIDKPPPGGFKSLEIGDSDTLQVGDFNFVMGSSFGLANEAPPTITAGVIAALVPFEESKRSEGIYETIYTSAAVNPGVNGGPVVDVEGRLIGTVSTFMGPKERFQFLGKCVPVARLRAAYKDRKEFPLIFPDKPRSRSRSKMSAQLATVFHHTARAAFSGVVSLEVTREGEFSRIAPAGRGNVQVPRYLGSVSGVLIDDSGYILTSLYNLTNVTTLLDRGWKVRSPYEAKVQPGLDAIKRIRVHFTDGESAPAKITGYSESLGIAMLKAEIESLPIGTRPLEPAPAAAYQAGRFVLALGNPYGAARPPDPLLTVGVLSKEHPMTLKDRWAGHWQTDAGCTDANAGGAAVNLRGELIGLLNMWAPLWHGRNSGIGFIVPWGRIAPHLEALKSNRKSPRLGVGWEDEFDKLRITLVAKGSAAAKAGLKVGDLLLSIDGQEIHGVGEAMAVLRAHWAGDQIVIRVRRTEKEELDLTVTLDAWPVDKRPEPKSDDEEEKKPRPGKKDKPKQGKSNTDK